MFEFIARIDQPLSPSGYGVEKEASFSK